MSADDFKIFDMRVTEKCKCNFNQILELQYVHQSSAMTDCLFQPPVAKERQEQENIDLDNNYYNNYN